MKDAYSYIQDARALMGQGETLEAVKVLETAQKFYPSDPAIKAILADPELSVAKYHANKADVGKRYRQEEEERRRKGKQSNCNRILRTVPMSYVPSQIQLRLITSVVWYIKNKTNTIRH